MDTICKSKLCDKTKTPTQTPICITPIYDYPNHSNHFTD